MISFDEFKTLFMKMPNSSEYEIYFDDASETYAIIKYADSVSFQRCGYSIEMIKEYNLDTDYIGSGEFQFDSLDELVNAELIDELVLLRDWGKISDIVVNNTYSLNTDIAELTDVYFGGNEK